MTNDDVSGDLFPFSIRSALHNIFISTLATDFPSQVIPQPALSFPRRVSRLMKIKGNKRYKWPNKFLYDLGGP
jgi:hypothetical protein